MVTAWSVSQLEDYSTGPDGGVHAGEARVIYSVHWECMLRSDDDEHVVRAYGQQSLEPFVGGDFAEWSEVTEIQALEWVHDKAPDLQAETEAQLADRLVEKTTPPKGNGIPWEAGE